MKKLYLKSFGMSFVGLCLLFGSSNAQAKGSISILGQEFSVDTLAHFVAGPGTTTTSLRLAGPKKLQVHYLTIDKTTPGVSLHAVCGRDMVAGTETVSSMAKRHSSDTQLYFAGANADFFTTSGNATNGTSKVGSPTTSCTVDGEIYKTSNSQYQFTVDRDGVAHIGRLNYYSGTATKDGKATLFKGVNVSSPNNGITIYTPRYWGSTNQTDYADNCYEVTARIVDGDNFQAGGAFRLEVTSAPTSDGDTPIPADGYVIHARGNSTTGCDIGAKDFVKALVPGDIVAFDNVVLLGDKRIYPQQIVSGNPYNLGGGEVLDTEGERGDAKDLHPRTGIGYSADGNTIVMMVVEGRSAESAGVRTSELAELLRYAGASEGMNLDGGGSSTLYTSAFGVRNHCSDGSERAVGNGIFAVVDAPADDKEVTAIAFADYKKAMPAYALYTPQIIAYNKYGVVVDTDFKGYTLSSSSEGNVILDDGKSLRAGGKGLCALTATCGDAKATICLDVLEASPSLFRNAVLIDGRHSYTAEVGAMVDGQKMFMDNSCMTWSSSDNSVATVDENGTITGLKAGTATISGKLGDYTGEIAVTVEIPQTRYITIPLTEDMDGWSITPTGMNSAAFAAEGENVRVDYNVKNSRTALLNLKHKFPLYAMPDWLLVEIDPAESTFSTITLTLDYGDAKKKTCAISSPKPEADGTIYLKFNIHELIADDVTLYPIGFAALEFKPSGSTKVDKHFAVKNLQTVYEYVDDTSVPGIMADDVKLLNRNVVSAGELLQFNGVEADQTVRIYNAAGVLVAASKASVVRAP